MAEHIWSILCSVGIIDQETNNVSLIGAIEQIQFDFSQTEDSPIRIPMQWTLVSLWRRDHLAEPEQFTGRLRVVGPDGQDLAGAQFEIDLSAHERTRTVTRQSMFVVTEPGTHRFVIETQQEDDSWDFITAVPLEVIDTA